MEKNIFLIENKEHQFKALFNQFYFFNSELKISNPFYFGFISLKNVYIYSILGLFFYVNFF